MTIRFSTTASVVALSWMAGSLAACGSEARQGEVTNQGAGGDASGSVTSTAGVGASGSVGATTTSTTGSGLGGASSSSGGPGPGGGGTGGEPDPWAGPVEALKELDLGDVPLQTIEEFPIPDLTLGFVAIASAPSLDEAIGIYRMRPPVGTSVIFDYSMTGHVTQYFANKGWIAGADPQADNADAVPVQSGNWRIVLGDDDQSIPSGHLRIWVRRTLDGNFHGGVMDVNVWIAPGVADSGYMNSVLGAMFGGGYAGITLGTVNYYSLAASQVVIETHDEYRQLLAGSSAVTGVPVLNLFVVGDFGNGDFGGAIGVAGGIPGAPVENGTTMSGVAYQPSGNVGYDATVLMHEVGHLGGLFHTTEFQTVETDPLSDTPECDSGTINSNPDACPDKTNVMFPIAYGATAFTTAQVRVLQGSALYRGILQDGGQPAPPLLIAPQQAALPASQPVWRAAGAHAAVAPRSGELEKVLAGVWCADAGVDHLALAARVAGEGRAGRLRLRALAEERGAPALLRARALRAFVRAASGTSDGPLALALASALAKDPTGASELRIAGMRALADASPTLGRELAKTIASTSDPIVLAVAARLGE